MEGRTHPMSDKEGPDLMQIATCSFAEYRPDMGGLPVCIANGAPRYKLRYPPYSGSLLVKVPELFPDWPLVQAARRGLDFENFSRRYRAKLHKVGADQIYAGLQRAHGEAQAQAREFGREVADNEPLVLLCHEKMGKAPDEYCHRRAFVGHVLKHLDAQAEIPEWGSVWQAETAAEQAEQESLF